MREGRKGGRERGIDRDRKGKKKQGKGRDRKKREGDISWRKKGTDWIRLTKKIARGKNARGRAAGSDANERTARQRKKTRLLGQ